MYLKLVENAIPNIKSGKIEVSVSQEVLKKETLKSRPYQFSIIGPRFKIDPDLIYGVYPPKNHSGPFENSLPHIILKRETLPWEVPLNDQEEIPYLAILLFAEDDIDYHTSLKSVSPAKASDLISPTNRKTLIPKLDLEDWEMSEEKKPLCQMIEVNYPFLKRILPNLEELKLLSHVRVSEDKQQLSVVMGNRLPNQNSHHTAHLVSLEGLSELFDETEKNYDKVRLISLASWEFETSQAHGTFKQHLNKLNAKMLSSPVDNYSLLLDGKGAYGEIPHRENLNPNLKTGFTLEFWFRRKKSSNPYSVILEKWESPHSPCPYSIACDNEGRLSLSYQPSDRNEQCFIHSITECDDECFHHLAITYSGSSLIFYIDNKIQGELAVDESIQNTGSIYIGSRRGESDFFYGNIGQLRIWRRALSHEDIKNFSTERWEETLPKELVGYWPLNSEISHGVLQDITLFGWNGALKKGVAEEISSPLTNKIKNGYTVLEHTPLGKSPGISWYCGPLIPYKPSNHSIAINDNPLESSESFLCYYSKQGLLDISFAAAWQIGLLLSLQNEKFSHDFFIWRRNYFSEMIRSHNLQSIKHLFKKSLSATKKDSSLSEGFVALSILNQALIPHKQPSKKRTQPSYKNSTNSALDTYLSSSDRSLTPYMKDISEMREKLSKINANSSQDLEKLIKDHLNENS